MGKSEASMKAVRVLCCRPAASRQVASCLRIQKRYASRKKPTAEELPPEPIDRLYSTKMEVHSYNPGDYEPMKTYRVTDRHGKVLEDADEPNFTEEQLVGMYKHMVTLNIMDGVLYDVQRQGRISFYMTSYGEEATHIGSAAALKPIDTVYGQYREPGVLLWRGFGLDNAMNQCYSNHLDLGKGRQMPVHYGSKELNFQTISSPLATQIPQAAGFAYARRYLAKQEDEVTVCYFGEGAASEGDFHAALNFASTLNAPVLFFCRNNGFAISTPAKEQFRGDGIASRARGYGMDAIRFDGNDIFAVFNATKRAREISVTEGRPVLLEAMTYRVGHHSTSDDSSRYREVEEVQYWQKYDNPILRVNRYMQERGWWSDEQDAELVKLKRKEVIAAMRKAESQKKPPIKDMFEDVYDVVPPHLLEQQQEINAHVQARAKHYPLDDFYQG